jgi:hypothetical protein
MTLRELKDVAESIKLRDGREVPIERILAIRANHIATCTAREDRRRRDRELHAMGAPPATSAATGDYRSAFG